MPIPTGSLVTGGSGRWLASCILAAGDSGNGQQTASNHQESGHGPSAQLAAIAARIPRQTALLQTEAATSAALVLPFIRSLGYDPFDLTEVVPEFTADVGTKKGEKVDFAILRDGALILLFEVKHWNIDLGQVHASQLYRYFGHEGALRHPHQWHHLSVLHRPG
ncbi:MAG: hypothetical protein R3F60_14565 [bacterium]